MKTRRKNNKQRRKKNKKKKVKCQSSQLHPYLCNCSKSSNNDLLHEITFDASSSRLKTPHIIIENTVNKKNKKAKRAIKRSRMKHAGNVYLELTAKHNQLKRQHEIEHIAKQEMLEQKQYHALLMEEKEAKRRTNAMIQFHEQLLTSPQSSLPELSSSKRISLLVYDDDDDEEEEEEEDDNKYINYINDLDYLPPSPSSLFSITKNDNVNTSIIASLLSENNIEIDNEKKQQMKNKQKKKKKKNDIINSKHELGATSYFKKHHFKLDPIQEEKLKHDTTSSNFNEEPSHLYEKHTWYGIPGKRAGNVFSDADTTAEKLRQYNKMQSSIKRHFNSNVPPSFLYYAENYSATLCQSIVRGFFGKKKAKKRRKLLKQLKDVTRPFYWRREVARVYKCYSAWKWLSQYARLSVSAIIIQALVRKFLARIQYCNIQKSLRIFKRIAITARGGWAFNAWKEYAYVQSRHRVMKNVFKAWRVLARAIHALRVRLLWSEGSYRTSIIKGAFTKWWYYSGWVLEQEEKARLFVAFRRIRNAIRNKKRFILRVKRSCFVYWKMFKNLNKWRRKANFAAKIIQALSRRYLTRTWYFKLLISASLINRIIRGYLGKCKFDRHKILNLIRELIARWHRAVPEWRRLRILREKKLLYRQVVKRRHAKRASVSSVAPPSFNAILLGMNHHLVVEEQAIAHGLNVEEILNLRDKNKINDMNVNKIEETIVKIVNKKNKRKKREELGSDYSSSDDDDNKTYGGSRSSSEDESNQVNFKKTNFKTSNWS